MNGKIKSVLSTTLTAVLINFALATPSYAFWDLVDSFNFTGDNRDDVQTYSDFAKKRFSQRADIYDTVGALAAAPDTLTKLKFDWKIDNGHRFSGTLPFNNRWKFTNHWYTYQYPRHKDYTLELTPTAVPPVATFSKTAEAHYPWFPTDIITNLLSSVANEGGQVGGMLASIDNRDKLLVQQSGKEYEPEDVEAYKKSEAGGSTDGLEKIFHVYASLNKNNNGEYVYKYMASNATEQTVSGSWTVYLGEFENTRDVFDFEVGANEEKLIREFSSKEKPIELGGQVVIQLNDETFTFFAPAFAASGESDADLSASSSAAGTTASDMLNLTDDTKETPSDNDPASLLEKESNNDTLPDLMGGNENEMDTSLLPEPESDKDDMPGILDESDGEMYPAEDEVLDDEGLDMEEDPSMMDEEGEEYEEYEAY
ncbi:MAG: hypothetical protein JXA04_09230 [Gammaproteobacteria bacterium]|nr:hypothetical protein [Gammaproteobacteria bacterium]